MKKLLLSITTAMVTVVLLPGCLSLRFGGGSKKTTTEDKSRSYSVSLGQQLSDLQKAYESGAISEREYNAQRKKLMKDYGR